MTNTNNAPTRIAATGGAVYSSGDKGSNYFAKFNRLLSSASQDALLMDVFFDQILTMKQASIETGIDRANICWRVADWRLRGDVYNCGKRIDPATGGRATYYTTNRTLAAGFFKGETSELWRDLPEAGQAKIFEAIDAYLERKNFGVFIASAMDDDFKETWLKVQNKIDCITDEK